ncbi:hypothetical protein [Nocardiopsis tropica]
MSGAVTGRGGEGPGGGPPGAGPGRPRTAAAGSRGAGPLTGSALTFGRLSWFTALRLLVSPFLLVAGALAVLMTLSTANQPLVHTRADLYESAVTSALIVALGLFAAVTFPAIREVRYGRSPVGPLGRAGRFLAVGAGAALVGWACVAALLALDAWQYAGPVPGLVHPLSHLTPFVVVLVGPAGAMALVAWTRSYTPLLLIALVVPTYGLYTITAFDTAQSVDRVVARVQSLTLMALDPFPVYSPGVPVLVQLYAAYLGLTVLGLVALGLAATGRRASRAAALGTALVLLAGAGGTAAHGATAYTWGVPVSDRLLYGADTVSCRTREGVTYCPMPGYEPWVEQWHEVLGPVLSALPEAAADDIPVVWQDSTRFDRDPAGLPPSRVVVYDMRFTDGPWWRLDLLDGTARAVFGLAPLWESMCRADGQSRLLLAAWMAGLDPQSGDGDRRSRSGVFLGEYSPSQQDLEVLHALLELPEERVSEVLRDHWEELSSPRGRTEELAGLLGIPLRGSPHESPAPRDWDKLFSGTDMAYHASPASGTVCA